MIVIEKTLDKGPAYDYEYMDMTDLVFFDIETTGLSADTSVLYLIGASYYEENEWKFAQWFVDDVDDEAKVIEAFFEILKTRKYLVNYNGNGFDIPYMKKKIKKLHLDCSFESIESLDLYKISRKYKDVLGLDNCKLTSIERYLGINRKDIYTGKELIDTYREFIKLYALERLNGNKGRESTSLLNDLLLHNEEDIINLLEVSKLNYIKDLFSNRSSLLTYNSNTIEKIEQEDYLVIEYKLDNRIDFIKTNNSIKVGDDMVDIILEYNKLVVKIKIYHTTLKYFYPNYKDYYYLPWEDMAMHKSIATYVDKEYRIQAKASNCYIKKEGNYVKAPDTTILPIFKQSYEEKQKYISLIDIEKQCYYDTLGKTIFENI